MCLSRFSALANPLELGYIRPMLWYLFQISVFLSVMSTGIYYEWTPSGLALSIVAMLTTLLATVIVSDSFRLIRWASKKVGSVLPKKRADQRFTGRRRSF